MSEVDKKEKTIKKNKNKGEKREVQKKGPSVVYNFHHLLAS